MDKESDRDLLEELYERLLEFHGPQHWWPGDGWFETMVGAVLTQAASWKNVEMALDNLKAAGALSPASIRRMDGDELAALLYPSGYYHSKAKKLKALAQFVGDRFSDSVELMRESDGHRLREELLGVYGVGQETADAILLYAVGKARFVVDSYTKRILSRIGAIEEDASYGAVQRLFEQNLTPETDHRIFGEEGLPNETEKYSEYHALLVRHGNSVCMTKPACDRCCLADLCETGRSALGI